MAERKEAPHSRVQSTYKAREVEGVLDLYFYRPIGFRLAEWFAQLKMTPGAVKVQIENTFYLTRFISASDARMRRLF